MQLLLQRIHLLLIIALIMTFAVNESIVVHANEGSITINFPDQELLQKLIEQEIIVGDGSGDYALDRSITRAEWLTLLKRMVDKQHIRIIKPSIPIKYYTELEHHWAKDDVSYWIEHGIIVGDNLGRLRLDEPVTIVELLVILDRIISDQQVSSEDQGQLAQFKNHWAYPSLNRLYREGWMRFDQPLWKQEIQLDRLALRGEGLLLLSHFYDQKEESKSATMLSEVKQLLDHPLDVDGDGKLDFSFRFSNPSYELELVTESERKHAYFIEQEWLYDVRASNEQIGQFRFQLKQVKDQDFTYFIRYTPTKANQEPLSLELIYYGQKKLAGRIPVSAIGEDKLPYDWEHIVIDQQMELPHASVYLQDDELEFRIGATDTFRNLGYTVRDYQAGDQTRSFIHQSNGDQHFTFTFTNKLGYYSETWGMLAKSGLFAWERSSFENFVLRDDVSINRKLSLDGLYYRTPNNYVPRTSYSYYLNPANIMGVRAIGTLQMEKNKGRYIDDLVILLGQMAVDQQNEEGFWPTEPKSEWLEKDYGIGYQYFDNRRNADNATFLVLLYQHYPDEQIKKVLERHVDYLYKAIEDHSVRTSEYGLLFTDYIGKDENEMSHIALNHHLAVINFLLDWSIKMDDEKAKSYASRMVTGIVDTENLWIKENHDLYYALFADLTPHHYSDYIDLTLSDLRMTQAYLMRVFGEYNDSLYKLMDSKQQWLDMRLRPTPSPLEDLIYEEDDEEDNSGETETPIDHESTSNE